MTTPAPPSVLLVPMPIPRTPQAPHFNGKYVTDFLTLITQHGVNAGISNKDELVPYIVQYSSDQVKDLIRYLPQFDPDETGKTWVKAKEELTLLYGHAEETPDYSEQVLRDYCQEQSAKSPFSNKLEVETYYRGFALIAGPLIKKSQITEVQRNFYFIAGLPKRMKEWFQNQAPSTKRTRSDPPTISESVAILQKRFDKESLTYEPWSETTELKDSKDNFDPEGNRKEATSQSPTTSSTSNRTSNIAGSDKAIEELTRQLESLHLNIASLKSLQNMHQSTQNQSASGSNPNSGSNNAQKRCFMCGKVGEQPLHPSRCPETRFLLDSGSIKYDTGRDRYVMHDGTDLPRTPNGFLGGVADYIRALQRDQAQPPQAARTNAIGLSYGQTSVLDNDYFAVSSLDVRARFAEPVTRTGKDSSPRFDPIGNKGKDRVASNPGAPSKSTQNTNNSPPVVPPNSSIPPPTNPINRQEGWKDSRPSNKPKGDDVLMRDAKKPDGDKYRLTSNIQERTDATLILEHLMNMDVTLPLFQLVGSSPSLQKLLSEATRAKREYGAKQAEFFRHGEESDVDAFIGHTQVMETGARRVYAQNTSELPEFLVKYGNAIAKVPEGRYFAMTTGSLTLSIHGIELTAMIDCGSELNLAGSSIPSRCGLAVDFEGMKWALKGIHGGPEQLRGCATDVPMKIGRHEFPHHLFISHQELEPHNIILGQPFLQWFAARLDYERSGTVSLYLWKEGNRKVHPTIVVTITDPLDPRNTSTMTRGHSHPMAYVEDVTDEEDF
ncbi:hypothetical protein C8J57DRAFT_1525011 [Mycena rebaudengoi]|nr:hypothetical protein C8J57DRAFT_1525011 [Mycena rebaudengoi]